MNKAVERIYPSHIKRKYNPWNYFFGLLGILAIGLITYSALGYFHQTTKPIIVSQTAVPTITATVSIEPTPTPAPKVARLLDGVLVDPGKENVHPLAVMIENHPDARPQFGLGQANLVYEAIAEGGITRFMAIYADPTIPVRVGPVRSARTYFVDFATELHAFYAHVGGNNDALVQIRATNVLDLDQFSIGAPTYQRDLSRPVALEHTMYSSTEKLWDIAVNKKGWSKTADFTPWHFDDDPLLANRPTKASVTVDVSGPDYKVVWNYNPATNSYSRTMAGAAHVDANTNQVIQTKNVVTETVDHQPTVTAIGEKGQKFTLTGTGKAMIFHNGTATIGTWKKSGTGRTIYYDSTGNEITFTRGTVWVHIVHPESTVTYD